MKTVKFTQRELLLVSYLLCFMSITLNLFLPIHTPLGNIYLGMIIVLLMCWLLPKRIGIFFGSVGMGLGAIKINVYYLILYFLIGLICLSIYYLFVNSKIDWEVGSVFILNFVFMLVITSIFVGLKMVMDNDYTNFLGHLLNHLLNVGVVALMSTILYPTTLKYKKYF